MVAYQSACNVKAITATGAGSRLNARPGASWHFCRRDNDIMVTLTLGARRPMPEI